MVINYNMWFIIFVWLWWVNHHHQVVMWLSVFCWCITFWGPRIWVFLCVEKDCGPCHKHSGFIEKTLPNGICCFHLEGYHPYFETFSRGICFLILFSDVGKYRRRVESSSMIYGRVHEQKAPVTCPPMKHSAMQRSKWFPSNWLLSIWWRDCFIARHPTHPQVIYFLKGVFDWFCFLVVFFNKLPSCIYIYIYLYSCIYIYICI